MMSDITTVVRESLGRKQAVIQNVKTVHGRSIKIVGASYSSHCAAATALRKAFPRTGIWVDRDRRGCWRVYVAGMRENMVFG